MKPPLIIANWKMNPDTPARAVQLAQKIEHAAEQARNVQTIIAPPCPFLLPIATVVTKARLGAQNVFWADTGPYTGEVSWRQLKALKAQYVILGHSERRIHLGETDELVRKKVSAVLENGLTAVLCVGERHREGDDIPAVVGEQVHAALKGIKKRFLSRLVIAYEPIWAISTNPDAKADTPSDAFRAMIYIRKIISQEYGVTPAHAVRIIYGGSVHARNIVPFLREGRMQGALVGRASLDAKEFGEIIRRAGLALLRENHF